MQAADVNRTRSVGQVDQYLGKSKLICGVNEIEFHTTLDVNVKKRKQAYDCSPVHCEKLCKNNSRQEGLDFIWVT